MFILSQIKAKTSQEGLFTPLRRKYLKFQVDNTVKKYPFPSKMTNNYQLSWEQELTFPERCYLSSIPFEVFEWHKFGFDQNELNGVLVGSIKIDRDAETFNSQIRMSGDNRMVGYLSGRVRHKDETKQKMIERKAAVAQVLYVKSMVAHIPLAINKKIFLKLNFGSKELRTKAIKTFCGDLVYTQPLSTDKLDTETRGKLTIWELLGTQEIELGDGFIDLVGAKPNKRVMMYNWKKELMGQIYVHSLQEEKEEIKKKSSSMPNYLNKISPKKLMDQTTSSRVSVGFKKISAIKPNQSIIFPTQRRFKETGNPQTFSMVKTFRRTKMPVSQIRANRIFNKASQLSTIVESETPGVGQYQLPSIWDRY